MSEKPKTPPAATKKTSPSNQPTAAIPADLSEKLAAEAINHFMSRTVIYATPTTTIRMAMQMMLNHKISGLPVVDNTLTVLGVFSEIDAMLQAASQHLDSKIKYNKPAKTVPPHAKFRDVLIFMAQNKLKRIPVVDNQKKLIGIVSRRDLLEAYMAEANK